MYKEYRDVTVNGAIEQMYAEMAGRHRARKSSIQVCFDDHPNRNSLVNQYTHYLVLSLLQIVAVNTITAKQCKRPATIQYLKSNIRFPRTVAIPRASSKQFRTTFVYQRPNVFAL
jgi:large subunit ribosomal protein L18Ae